MFLHTPVRWPVVQKYLHSTICPKTVGALVWSPLENKAGPAGVWHAVHTILEKTRNFWTSTNNPSPTDVMILLRILQGDSTCRPWGGSGPVVSPHMQDGDEMKSAA